MWLHAVYPSAIEEIWDSRERVESRAQWVRDGLTSSLVEEGRESRGACGEGNTGDKSRMPMPGS